MNRKTERGLRSSPRKFRCCIIVTLITLLAIPVLVTLRIQQIVLKGAADTKAVSSQSEMSHSLDIKQQDLSSSSLVVATVALQDTRIFQDAQYMQDSCSQLMGNSFTSKQQVCEHVTCWTSSVLRSSNCYLQNVTLVMDHVKVAQGGIAIEHVLGQDEKDEFPIYSSNAWLFDTSQPPDGSHRHSDAVSKTCTKESFHNSGVELPHYLNQVTEAIGSAASAALPSAAASLLSMGSSHASCSYTIMEPTFAITRYDYANLFHTMCDWYNFYQAIQVSDHRNTKIQVLLLDGHPAGNLDETWATVFGNTIRISDLKQQYSNVCFRELYLVGPGYNSPFFPESLPLQHNCFGSIHIEDFRNSFLLKHGISTSNILHTNDDTRRKKRKTIRIGYLFRKDYLAHPRQGSQPKVSRKIRNEQQLLTTIQEYLDERNNIKAILTPLYLESLTLKQQLQQIAKLDILVGMHGAGLSHVLFMESGSVLIELAPVSHARLEFFEIMAKVNGVHYIKQTQGIQDDGGGGEYFHIDPNLHISTLQHAMQQLKM